MAYETIRYERDGHVAVLTYDRPDQRNAVSRQMNAELHDAWARFRDEDDAFVLVITGEGEAFCAGWDLADAAATTAGRLGRVPDPRLQLARGLRIHAPDRRLQARDSGGEWLGGRGRPRERAPGRYPDRRRKRGLRRSRAPLEHRRRRRDDRPAASRRRLRKGDGDDHHRPPGRREGGPSDRPRKRGRADWDGPRARAAGGPRGRRLCRRARSAPTRRR